MCQSQPPISWYPFFPHLCPYVCSLRLCLCLYFANRFICTIFSRFHIDALIYSICFSLSDFILYDSLWVHPCLCKWHSFFNTIIIVLLRIRKLSQKQINISNILELEIRILDLNLRVYLQSTHSSFFNLFIFNWRIITTLYWFLPYINMHQS